MKTLVELLEMLFFILDSFPYAVIRNALLWKFYRMLVYPCILRRKVDVLGGYVQIWSGICGFVEEIT